jgi:hypothetical protein
MVEISNFVFRKCYHLSSLQIWSIGLRMTNNSALIVQQVLVLVDELKLLKVEKTMRVFR